MSNTINKAATNYTCYVDIPFGGYTYEEGDRFWSRNGSVEYKDTGSSGGSFHIFVSDIDEMDDGKSTVILSSTVKYNGTFLKSSVEKVHEENFYLVTIFDCPEIIS